MTRERATHQKTEPGLIQIVHEVLGDSCSPPTKQLLKSLKLSPLAVNGATTPSACLTGACVHTAHHSEKDVTSWARTPESTRLGHSVGATSESISATDTYTSIELSGELPAGEGRCLGVTGGIAPTD